MKIKTSLLTVSLVVAPLLVVPVAIAFGTNSLQEPEEFQPAKPSRQHEWLQQLVGEWTVTSEMTMGPDTEPMKMEATESVRAIGELWTVAEMTCSMPEMPMTALMTLGYDPKAEEFVGTWIDSMQTHLWKYTGSLDEARKKLTLEAEGPSFTDPNKTALYRDAIELVSPDHKVLTSSVKNEDGTWTQFMKADYKRKR